MKAGFIAVLSVFLCAQAGAQSMHKCKDAKGKITYAGQECEDLGLKPAGDIQERSSVAPAFRAPAAPAARPKPVPAKGASPAAQGTPAPAAEGTDAERRCFKTAKGFRCNDIPETN